MSPSRLLSVSDHDDRQNEQQMSCDKKSQNQSRLFLPPSTSCRIISAEGNYLSLSNGQKVFDATGGPGVACLGYGDTRVQNAMVEQIHEISYAYSGFYSTSAAEDLSQFLIDSTGGEMSRVFFASSGSEAVEAALKLARQYHLEKASPETSRTHIIARSQSYHGNTLGALGVGGHAARRAIYEPLLSPNSSRVQPCHPYRHQAATRATPDYVAELEADLEHEFQRVGPQNVAAFIAEPVVGAAMGCVAPVNGYFTAIRKVCDRHGALLIFDEVMCGSGRVGPEPSEQHPNPLHAWQDPLIGVVPDIMTMGKGLGAGYMPIAAMLASRRVVRALDHGSGALMHGQTYQAHALACKAALAVQTIISTDDLVANVRVQGETLGRLLRTRLADHAFVGDVRGRGLFWAIELVKDKSTREPFDPSLGVTMGIHDLAMKEPYSISLYPAAGCADGHRGDCVLLAPSYKITTDDVRLIVDLTARVINDYFRRHCEDVGPDQGGL